MRQPCSKRTPSVLLAMAVVLTVSATIDTTSAALSHNKLASNKLAANKLASNKLAANKLASNKLAANSLSSTRLEADLATAELLSTHDGRIVYSYLIGCALPDGTTIEADITGAPDSAPPDTDFTCVSEHCIFPGALGLAEDWIDRRLDNTGQGWVSACIFARVNAHDTAVSISLRAPHANLEVSQDEIELFPGEEGAFFGNLFVGEDEPIDWNVCRGRGQAANEGGGYALRDCTEPDPANPGKTYCGFNFAGDCGDFLGQGTEPYACGRFDAAQGVYSRCHATEGLGHWQASPPYRQVITSYVAP